MQRKIVKNVQIGLAAAAFVCAPSVWADQEVSALFDLPIHISGVVDESGCDNSPGPQITLGGEIALGNVKARVIFSNNLKGTQAAAASLPDVPPVMLVSLALSGRWQW